MQGEWRVVGLVSLEQAGVTDGGGAAANPALRGLGAVDGLVAVGEKHDLGVPVAVVASAPAEEAGELAVEADVVLIFPVIGSQPVVVNGVADVVAARNVPAAATEGVRHGAEDLEVKRVRITAPAGIDEVLPVDGNLDGIIATGPGDAVESGAEAARNDAEVGRVLELVDRVIAAVGVDEDRAEVLAIGRDDRLPAHVGGDVDLVGNGALADGGAAHVDDDVGSDLALPSIRREVHEVDAEVNTSVGGAAIAETEGDGVARAVAGIGAVDIGSLAAALIVFIEHEQIFVRPISESADGDGPLARPASAASVGLVRVRAVGKFGGVVEVVVVGIARRTVVDVAGAAVAEAVSAVVERIEAVVDLPAFGQSVTVRVDAQRIGLADDDFRPTVGLRGAVAAGCVGGEQRGVIDRAGGGAAEAELGVGRREQCGERSVLSLEEDFGATVEIMILAVAVVQPVTLGVGFGGSGLLPSLKRLDCVVGPVAEIRAVRAVGVLVDRGGKLQRFAVSVGPAVAVGILDAIGETVTVGIGIERISHRAGRLAGAVVALALRADAGHRRMVLHHGMKRGIQVADEVGGPIAVAVGRQIGRR